MTKKTTQKAYRIADSSGSRTILAATADEAVREYQRLERIRERIETVADLADFLERNQDWLVIHENGETIYMTQGR
jgi:CMP-N-acetylneuraminic acid synthetase